MNDAERGQIPREPDTMLEMLAYLTPLARTMASKGYAAALEYLESRAPFRRISHKVAGDHQGWVIPPRWDVTKATLSRNGRVIYDGTRHALGVIALSAPFRGRVSLEELARHLHHDPRWPDALPYHYRQMFRSWNRDWGFCVPGTLRSSLEPGDYDVEIETEEGPGSIDILEWTLPGRTEEMIVVGANLDHPGVANDGPSGCVVGIEAFRRLALRDRHRTWRLVLLPGILGSEFYLARMGDAERERILEAVFLQMLGSRTELALQRSRSGDSEIDRSLGLVLDRRGETHRSGAFDSLFVNDEYVWEAHGISTTSLSRYPYPEYHSSRDGLSIIDPLRLAAAVQVLTDTMAEVDASPLVIRKFRGSVCLSNPRYDLYCDYGQVALGEDPDEAKMRMRRLMDLVPTLRRPTSIRSLAEESGVPEAEVKAYLDRWVERGLLEIR